MPKYNQKYYIIFSYWNFNKLKSQQHFILQSKVLHSDRYLSTIRPSIFAKRCCPEGKIARAKRVPIWMIGCLLLLLVGYLPAQDEVQFQLFCTTNLQGALEPCG